MIYDTLNPCILRMVSEDAKSEMAILDVGCATGRLGKELKLDLIVLSQE